MNIQHFLTQFGLSDTEATLYLAMLSFEHASAAQLAEKTTLKRPRVYHALETLQEKGLVTTIGSKVKRFKAEPPKQLAQVLERKKYELEVLESKLTEALPLFPLTGTQFGMGDVEVFRGKGALHTLAERVYASKAKEMFAINPSFQLIQNSVDLQEGLAYLKGRAKRNIHVKTIWQDLPQETLVTDHETYLREMRFAPKETFGEFKSSIQIFDNKVFIMNFAPEMFGTLITSVSFAQSMKCLWQLLWDAAKHIDEDVAV